MLYDYQLRSQTENIFRDFFVFSLQSIKNPESYRVIIENKSGPWKDPRPTLYLDLEPLKVLLNFKRSLPPEKQRLFYLMMQEYGFSKTNLLEVWSTFLLEEHFSDGSGISYRIVP